METMPKEFWIVVTQYDMSPNSVSVGRPPNGPLVHEGFMMTEEQAKERARCLAGRLGWTTVLRVEVPPV